MKHTKETLRKAVIKVFENECRLDNYEMAALVAVFEDYLNYTEPPFSTFDGLHDTMHRQLLGVLNFLVIAQHISEDQRDALSTLMDEVDDASADGE